MKKKLFYPLSFFFFQMVLTGLVGQNSTYMRTYNFPGMNGGLGLSSTSDGGFVGTGQHEGGPAGSCDVYVYKVTGCGSLEWYKTFGSPASDGGKKVIQTSDGGYAVIGLWDDGSGSGGGYDYLLMKLNSAGALQWNTVWNGSGNSGDYGIWLEEASGGYITAGNTYASPWGNWNAVVMFYNNLGTPVWARAFGGGSEDAFGSVHAVSGGYIAGGKTSSFGAGGSDLMAVKVNASGTPVWMNAYGGPGNEGRYWDTEGIPTPDGGYILAGATDYGPWSQGSWDILLVKLDANGVVQWAKTYGGSNEEVAEGIAVAADGYAITGYTYTNTNGGRDAFILKIDTLGNFQWVRAYGTSGTDRGVDIIPVNGGNSGYVLSMNRETSPGSGDYDPMFVRTDSLGDCGCNNISSVWGVMNVTSLITTTPLPATATQNFISNITISSPVVTTGAPTPNENFICISCTPVTPSFIMSDTIICANETATLINTTPPGTASCFEWVANGNVFSTVQDTVVASFPPGTYNIQLKAICGNNIQSASATLVVNPVPTAGFTGPLNVCESNLPVSFTNTGSTGAGISFQWNFGNGAIPQTSTQENPSNINYTYGGSKNIKQVVINQFGCKDSIIKTMYVEPLPNITFSAQSPVCIGDSMLFTNNSWVGGTGVISQWVWDFGDGNYSGQFQPWHTYLSPGTYTVELKAVSDYGCADSSTITVEVSPLSVGGQLLQDDTVCSGQNSGMLQLTGNTGTPVQWEYSTDGGINWFAISNTGVQQPYNNLTQDRIYRVLVKSGACPAVYSDTVMIKVDALSEGGVVLRDTVVCIEGNSGMLLASGYNGTIVTWQVSTDGGQSWQNTNTSGVVESFTNLTDTTLYRVIVKNGVCPADTSAYATVWVRKFNGAYTSGDTTISLGDRVQVYAGGGMSYLWRPNVNINDTTISNPEVWPVETQQYTVVVWDEYGCADTSQLTVYVIRDYKLEISNTLTPNGDGYNDTWWIGNIENYPANEVQIFNRYGQLIYSKEGYMNEWDGRYKGERLPNGTYFFVLKIKEGEGVVFKGHINIVGN